MNLDVTALVAASGVSDEAPRRGELRPAGALGGGRLQQRFPVERFEALERWIVERSAKVHREMAAQGATWTPLALPASGDRRRA